MHDAINMQTHVCFMNVYHFSYTINLFHYFLAQFIKQRNMFFSAQKTIRLDIEHHSCFPYSVYKFTTLKEEIFLLSRTDGQTTADVRVYKRNKFAKAIAVIALSPGSRPLNVEACSVSNCVYVLCANEKSNEFHQSVLRIRKAGKHRYNISPWVSDLSLTHASISVLPNGILSVTNRWDPVELRNYDANGSLVLSTDIYGLGFVDRVLEKANGNLVLGSVLRNDMNRRVLTEIAKDGRMRWQHVSSIDVCMLNRVHFADAYDRILIADYMGGSELLDSELNLLESEELRPSVDIIQLTNYDSARNEVVGVCFGNPDFEDCRPVFCTFRFTEE